MMTVAPQLVNLIKKLQFGNTGLIGCIHISHAKKTHYVSVVYCCASVLSCSRPSIRRMGGGMHLLINV